MIPRLIGIVAGVAILAVAGVAALYWFTFRVYVPEGQSVVLVKKTGVEPKDKIAENPNEKGIHREVLGPGRYFFNPFVWEAKPVPLVEISCGNPRTWEWTPSPTGEQRGRSSAGTYTFKGSFPEVGVLKRVVGPEPPDGAPVVARASGYQGTVREVLTPGTYRINPWVYKVEKHPAVVIPAGFVGVVTNQVGEAAPLRAGAGGGADEDAVRRLARAGERGTLRDVLQPGIYYINPYVQKVTLIEIGFNEYSEVRVGDQENLYISFPSDTGYDIRVGVTIIWGIDPKHAAQIINEFGNVDRVLETVIGSQLPSICRNIGSTYDARDFIHGEKRELFQRALTEELQEICRAKNVEVLLALVREIEVHAPKAGTDAADEVSEDLKRTIQQSYLAIENRITKEKQREAAIVRAELEEARKKVDIARETILADTRVMVAEILAEAEKEAAQIDAQAKLEVAQVQEQIAKLDAQRTEILGQARTDVDKLKKQAEADGYRLLVDAFGGGRAFNLYTFAENFQPESIRLFFAGDGTFWTDLDRFQDVGAAKILESGVAKD